MKLVVDANVLFSFFKRDSLTRKLITSEFLLIEVEKHKEELLKETKLPKGEFDEVMEFLVGEITFVPS